MSIKILLFCLVFCIPLQATASAETGDSSFGDEADIIDYVVKPRKTVFIVDPRAKAIMGVRGCKIFRRHARDQFGKISAPPLLQRTIAEAFRASKGKLQSNEQFMFLFDCLIDCHVKKRLDDFVAAVAYVTSSVRYFDAEARILDSNQEHIIKCAKALTDNNQLDRYAELVVALTANEPLKASKHCWPYFFEEHVIVPYTTVLESGVTFDESHISSIKRSLSSIQATRDLWSTWSIETLYGAVASEILSYKADTRVFVLGVDEPSWGGFTDVGCSSASSNPDVVGA